MTEESHKKLCDTIIRIRHAFLSLKGAETLLESPWTAEEIVPAQLNIISRELENLSEELEEYEFQEGKKNSPYQGGDSGYDLPPMIF